MKISKLFHWLYALVMLLPIFAIGVTCAYAIFNKNAYRSYAEKITNTYLINNSNTSLLQQNHKYIYNGLKYPSGMSGTGWQISYKFTFTNESVNLRDYFNVNYDVDGLAFACDGNVSTYFRPYLRNKTTLEWVQHDGVVYFNQSTANKYINLQFEFTLDTFDTNFYQASNINYLVITNGSIDNVFYYSIDKVQQSPLFNWAYNSFLVTPFAYIVSLFSMPTNSFVVMLLSYWLAISIIWLVFDLVMYVPLLVHRWLDKGVLE